MSQKQFDLRTVERTLREGTVSKKDYENHLKSLPDEAGMTEEITIADESTPPAEGKKDGEGLNEPTFSI